MTRIGYLTGTAAPGQAEETRNVLIGNQLERPPIRRSLSQPINSESARQARHAVR